MSAPRTCAAVLAVLVLLVPAVGGQTVTDLGPAAPKGSHLASTSAVWSDGVAYLFGGRIGHDGTEEASDEIWAFVPGKGLTVTPMHLPSPRFDIAGLKVGPSIYLVGGHIRGHAYTDILRFDPASGRDPVKVGDLPVSVYDAGLYWDGESLFVLGGANEKGIVPEVFRFRPGMDSTATAFGSTGACSPSGNSVRWTSVVAGPDAAYVIGGNDGLSYLNTVCRVSFAGSAAQASRVFAIPDEAYPAGIDATAAAFDGQHIYVFGGGSRAAPEAQDVIYRYDPVANTGELLCGRLPQWRREASAVAISPGNALVFGGFGVDWHPLPNVVLVQDLEFAEGIAIPDAPLVSETGVVRWVPMASGCTDAQYRLLRSVGDGAPAVAAMVCQTAAHFCIDPMLEDCVEASYALQVVVDGSPGPVSPWVRKPGGCGGGDGAWADPDTASHPPDSGGAGSSYSPAVEAGPLCPVLGLLPDTYARPGMRLEVSPTVRDPDGGQPVFLPPEFDPVPAVVADFDSATGTLRWEPDATDAGKTYEVTLSIIQPGVRSCLDSATFSVRVLQASAAPTPAPAVIEEPMLADSTAPVQAGPATMMEYATADEPCFVQAAATVGPDVAILADAPPLEAPGPEPRYAVVEADGASVGCIESVELRFVYSNDDLPRGTDPEDLAIHYFDGAAWVDLHATAEDGVDVVAGQSGTPDLHVFGAGVDTEGQVVWARVDHTSTYAMGGPGVGAQPTSTTTGPGRESPPGAEGQDGSMEGGGERVPALPLAWLASTIAVAVAALRRRQ